MADERGGDVGEGEELLGLAFLAAVQASTAGQPRHGTFDDPAVQAKPLRGLDTNAAAVGPGEDGLLA